MSASSEAEPGAERSVILGQHLHARPAGQVAQLAARNQATGIEIVAGGRRVNARSVLAVMGLGALKGSEVQVIVTGPDADAVADEIVTILHGPEFE